MTPMRKDLLAIGIFLIFLGLISVASSRVAIKPEPTQDWVVVEKTEVLQPTEKLSVQGDLTSGDRFRANFGLSRSTGPGIVPEVSMILVNLTDPNGEIESSQIPLDLQGGAVTPMAPFPKGIANYTGTYKVDARTIGVVLLNEVALEKMEIEEKELQYPYANLLPIGIAIFIGGFGISLLGVKLSKRKRMLYKRRSHRRKTRSKH